MPAAYEVDPDRFCIDVDYTGALRQSDVTRIMEALILDPRLRLGMGMLSDHSHSTTFATPALVVGVMPSLGRLAGHFGHLRVAMITPRDVQLGMANMAAVHAALHGVEIKPFRHRPEAEDWLLGDAKRLPSCASQCSSCPIAALRPYGCR